MNIEQKLAYLQKALELGADISVNFHFIKGIKEAEKIASNFTEIAPFEEKSGDAVHWLKIRDRENPVEVTVFYQPTYMVDDVNLTGDENVAI